MTFDPQAYLEATLTESETMRGQFDQIKKGYAGLSLRKVVGLMKKEDVATLQAIDDRLLRIGTNHVLSCATGCFGFLSEDLSDRLSSLIDGVDRLQRDVCRYLAEFHNTGYKFVSSTTWEVRRVH